MIYSFCSIAVKKGLKGMLSENKKINRAVVMYVSLILIVGLCKFFDSFTVVDVIYYFIIFLCFIKIFISLLKQK